MLDLHKKVNELVIENSKLKERIAQLEGDALKHKQQGNAGDDYSNITGFSSSIQNQGGEFSFQNQVLCCWFYCRILVVVGFACSQLNRKGGSGFIFYVAPKIKLYRKSASRFTSSREFTCNKSLSV